MKPVDFIAWKRDGYAHSDSEMNSLIEAISNGSMPDYQTAAWLMAAYLNGLDESETLSLTSAMRDSGMRVDLSSIPGVKLDKHSSGGVGDKTTLVVVPLLAAAGVPILKMSGRGLGFSGGTIDKLESIPGFRTDISLNQAIAQVKSIGAAIIGQSPDLVPADKKLYSLRDVTATVDSVPLITASIMSKKLASGADCVLLDVKVGRGSFMKSLDKARGLAEGMVRIGNKAGVRTVAVLTNMDEPLGFAVGNALEVREACELLTGTGRVDARFRELCLSLTSQGLVLAGKAEDSTQGVTLAESLLESGKGADKFEQIIAAQAGEPRVVRSPENLLASGTVRRVRSDRSGFVAAIDAESVGRLCVSLGGGREKKDDLVDHSVGVVLRKKVGDRVGAGEVLADMYIRSDAASSDAAGSLRGAFDIRQERPPAQRVLLALVQQKANR